MKKKALWIAPDNRRFTVEFENETELYEKIAALRDTYGFPQPDPVKNNTVMTAVSLNPALKLKSAIEDTDLPDELSKALLKATEDKLNSVDPKKVN